ASANYMVEDLCLFLRRLGVEISSLGGADIKIKGLRSIKKNITYHLSEDPIEAMFFISLAVCTGSELTVKRCPIKFLRLELEKLRRMGLRFRLGSTYKAKNGHTDLVDIVIYPSRLTALPDKIHSLPFPGINIDNLPFFVPIAARAKGTTMIHDWVYENRAVYFSELNRLGAKITLLDPHRVLINGPVRFRGAEMVAPPALRPAAILLVAMLAASGQSVLRNVYPINRGYENLSERLREIGADIRYVKECSPSFKDAKNSPKSAN
ncbi:MAG TPA: UDP-N-acetylglucosamine 1-carboxyvinyltransferase, partial [Candidatus Moranbacteria bacterium]|nr:UDP-N-acetylglucosamine 1-carboxyvinyltransferase [Candidatus Moranbacteria bacterium]